MCKPGPNEYDGISLGLSGGLDSRALFSSLLHNKLAFDVYVFGCQQEADVQIAKRIAHDEGICISHFDDPIPASDDCIRMMKEYAGQACVSMPVSSIIRLRYFDRLRLRNRIMIDGGFGELCRRQYLNRLLWKGQWALKSGDVRSIIPNLSVPRAPIFTEEIRKSMEEGVETELVPVLAQMPPLKEIGTGNFLDLLAIRTRVPNWNSAEQARLDTQVANFMPFVQPSLLRIVFTLPTSIRANGRLLRRLLRTETPSLSHYPLVKGETTYPFRLKTMQAWVWTHAKAKMGMSHPDTTRIRILENIRSFVLDTVASQSVRSYGAYNYSAICGLTGEFYKGNVELANALDWWLTFELWRQSIRST